MTVPPPYPPGYPAGYPPRTNGMAIASLVSSVLFAPLGIVFGHISLGQINRSGEQGRGIAIAGLIIGYVFTALGLLMAVLLVVFAATVAQFVESPSGHGGGPVASGTALPAFDPPADLGANCQYPATTERAAKPATPPRTGTVPTDPATVSASVSTNRGDIGLTLSNGQSPCTVNNFASLAQQGFFDDTPCHRLTAGELSVLQCGDPSGSGTGGPGYRFANEYPTNQYRLSDPALRSPVVYPRGTLATANAGPGTNGSQFFLVYADSLLPPTYTVFGTIDDTGLATLDKIAAGGVAGGGEDGEPAQPVIITSALLD
ncbi:peptidylprolyl isomerase [Mycobacterium sp. NPDC003449]